MEKELKHVKKYRENHLRADDSILTWGEGYIGEMMGKGDNAQHNGTLIVTNELVVFYRKGVFGEILETIPLKKITSIERKSTLGHRTLRIHASHDDLAFKCMNKEHEQRLLDAIENGRIESEAPDAQAPSQESNLDKLKKLAELRDAGILTDEEFDAKKTQLLAEV